MKTTVNKYLNARIEKASTNAACNFYRSPGDTIEIDDVLIGIEIDGNSIWYHCKDDGCYYWSGGITEEEFEIPNSKPTKELLHEIIKDIKKTQYVVFPKTIDGYTGIGIGYKNNNKFDNLALVFFVNNKKPLIDIQKVVPKFIIYKGFKIITDVVEMKKGRLHYNPTPQALNPDPDKHIPGAIGCKIFQTGFPAAFGTGTLKVLKGNKTMLLGCCHVMGFKKFINSITHNSITENDHFTLEVFDSLSGRTKKLNVVEGRFDGSIDYALADLPDKSSITNHFNGTLIKKFATKGEVELLWLENVQSIGRKSLLQEGAILHTSSQITFENENNANESLTFNDIIITQRLSTGGDSGAPVVKDDLLVGYVFGGDDDKFSYVIPFYKLEKICSIVN